MPVLLGVADCYCIGMKIIAQRELRNDISSVLRRAEHGESFTITVNGTPVAELGPLRGHGRRPADLDAILASTQPIRAAREARLTALLENTTVLPVDDAVASQYVELPLTLRPSSTRVGASSPGLTANNRRRIHIEPLDLSSFRSVTALVAGSRPS